MVEPAEDCCARIWDLASPISGKTTNFVANPDWERECSGGIWLHPLKTGACGSATWRGL